MTGRLRPTYLAHRKPCATNFSLRCVACISVDEHDHLRNCRAAVRPIPCRVSRGVQHTRILGQLGCVVPPVSCDRLMRAAPVQSFRAAQSKTPELFLARAHAVVISLTMSYFHTGIRTIIGAEAFHCPVRDGKEWDHLAMVIRLNRLPGRHGGRPSQFIESIFLVFRQALDCCQQTGKL